jgi:hypothetical protein
MLSLPAHQSLETLLNPSHVFVGREEREWEGLGDYGGPSTAPLPSDLQLIDLAPIPAYANSLDDASFIPTPQFGLLLRRVGFDGELGGRIPAALGQVRRRDQEQRGETYLT